MLRAVSACAVSGLILGRHDRGWGITAFFLAEILTSGKMLRLIERERLNASSATAAIDANIRLTLANVRSIPKVLARQPDIVENLHNNASAQRMPPLPQQKLREALFAIPELIGLSERLESIHNDFAIDQILVLNTAGDCIAAGGFPFGGRDEIGVNYADREYFKLAKKEGWRRQFAVGRTTNVPGIYYSAAVTANRQFLGAIVVKVDVARLSKTIEGQNAFVTDKHGVIIMAGESGSYMKVVPDASLETLTAEEKLNRYMRHQFERIAITPAMVVGETMFQVNGHPRPMLLTQRDNPTERISLWLFSDVAQVWEARNENFQVAALLFLAGASLITGATAGIVYLRRRKEHQAEMASINERLVRLNDELLRQARYDALTGCANRRYFLEELNVELNRAGRAAYPCCLAMLDIDQFKRINDLHGHAAGDAALQYFARSVSQGLRSSDLLGRFGGEEFLLLMPQTPLSGAIELGERIRALIENSEAAPPEIPDFTVSIGVVQWRNKGETAESFIARADQAMYDAKNSGRNRVHAETAVDF